MRKNQLRATIALSVIAIIGIGAYFGISSHLRYLAEEKAAEERREFVNESFVKVGMGETLVLDSTEDLKGADQDLPYVSYFNWDGIMEIRLISATAYETCEEAGLVKDDLFFVNPHIDENYVFVICELTIRNIDAESTISAYGPDYNISFLNFCEKGFIESGFETYYFDGTIEGADEKQGLYFLLDKGEEKTFHLGYYIEKDSLDEIFYYYPGAEPKYVIEFEIDSTL